MNLLAHMAVAERLDADPDVLLGSALPDIASAGRCRLASVSGVDGVDTGVRLHHRTDDVFHGLGWFTDLQRRLATDLRTAGMGRGPRRATAHVGVELLLDGALESDAGFLDRTELAFARLRPHHDRISDMAADGHQDRWRAHLEWIDGRTPPRDGLDAQAVARRLERICARRPRLAFVEGDVERATVALAEVADLIAAEATGVVADVVAELSARDRGARHHNGD